MGWLHGKLFEVFATLGTAGGCAMCFSGTLTRSITTGLRCDVPVHEFVKQLRYARCPEPKPFPKKDAVMSCSDAIGKTLDEYGLMSIEEVVAIMLDQGDTPSTKEEENEAAEAARKLQELKAQREEIEE